MPTSANGSNPVLAEAPRGVVQARRHHVVNLAPSLREALELVQRRSQEHEREQRAPDERREPHRGGTDSRARECETEPAFSPERVGARREKGWFSSEAGALGAGFKGRSSKGVDERTIRSPSGLRGQHRISSTISRIRGWRGCFNRPTREKRRQSGTRAVDDAAATPAPRRESRPCPQRCDTCGLPADEHAPVPPRAFPARGHLFFITPRAIPGARNRRRAPRPLRLAGTAPAMRRSESLKVFYVKGGVDGARRCAPARSRAPIPLSSSVTRFRP